MQHTGADLRSAERARETTVMLEGVGRKRVVPPDLSGHLRMEHHTPRSIHFLAALLSYAALLTTACTTASVDFGIWDISTR
jgi:hypothetical protein